MKFTDDIYFLNIEFENGARYCELINGADYMAQAIDEAIYTIFTRKLPAKIARAQITTNSTDRRKRQDITIEALKAERDGHHCGGNL